MLFSGSPTWLCSLEVHPISVPSLCGSSVRAGAFMLTCVRLMTSLHAQHYDSSLSRSADDVTTRPGPMS